MKLRFRRCAAPGRRSSKTRSCAHVRAHPAQSPRHHANAGTYDTHTPTRPTRNARTPFGPARTPSVGRTDPRPATGSNPATGSRPDGSPAADELTRRAGVWRQFLSLGVATGAYGVSFGALAVTSGLSLAQACTLSALMFTGGSQFAFAGVIGAGGAEPAAVATAGLLGARNGFYGLQMSPLLRATPARWVLAAHLTVDEPTAVATTQLAVHPGRPGLARLGFWATGGAVFVFWNLATFAGALLGNTLGAPPHVRAVGRP